MMQDFNEEPTAGENLRAQFARQTQYWLDRATPYALYRWIFFVCTLALYVLRVSMINGWFIVTYGLGIFLLNNFIGFLSPQSDPESDGPLLPTSTDDDFRPFSRRVPEFKFWFSSMKGVVMAFGMTFFSVFDIPVFWPILLVYFFALFFLTMKRQIKHMIKHNYVPWSMGKKSYDAGGKAVKSNK
ncbi:retrieval of early ER protein Rer1 [Pelagophyceae sp. CCMP2097]|nr:retrieval of early ER protein Rer1 [Pelagophyceae sp. CCMP2097]|mmetsp:Transcript_7542/g.24587  ORF Transcript_7542/g.24587 Transcript_7542/m.24587 type:complete len:185 (-) Transcript_7542:80-634(-)|eukprot:CAMPEP_0184094274 /NCGR_PEP_ID=MMETSP0974-20121125/9179_1 /TAXON_ID=483370 /ORGANISM="non described non described, Strain CCMP2097" /LENGTH=184 /DNA_ID=CAMNT_0026397059 /DNA_START=88 /DNA_END=642 /DNA_ORIENTATION=-